MAATVCLLFQWTEEREGKLHVGIFSDPDKAKKVAQLDSDQTRSISGDDPQELRWTEHNTSALPSFIGSVSAGDTEPYEIEIFTIDTFMTYVAETRSYRWAAV